MDGRRTPLTRAPKRRRGRPQVHDESWTKVSVVLFDRQIKRLDRLCHDMRRTSGTRMTRASLIRGLIDGLIDGGLETRTTVSEAALRDQIARLFRSAQKSRVG